MKKPYTQLLSLAMALTFCVGALSGCATTPSGGTSASTTVSNAASSTSAASHATTSESGPVVFTDSLGREVPIPADLQRIAPSGTLSQIVLYTIAPDRMVGWTSNPSKDMKKYFDAKYTNLPTFGTFYGKNADLNMEALLAANPQIIIDVGEVKGSKDDMISDLDGLQKQLGLPIVFIECHLEESGNTYNMLGKLLKMPAEAKALADYCDQTIADAKKNAAAVPADKKVRLYCGEGDTGLKTNPVGSFHCEVMDLIGAINVAEIPITSGSGGNEISMEQLLLWKPDVILLGPGSIFQTIGADPLWKDLTAVQQKKVYEVPSGPYNWIDRPPAVNRILGIKWMGNLLYPEQFAYDMVAETKTFYSLFYHYNLTDDEAKALLANSTLIA